MGIRFKMFVCIFFNLFLFISHFSDYDLRWLNSINKQDFSFLVKEFPQSKENITEKVH